MQYFDLPSTKWKASKFAFNSTRFAFKFSELKSISTMYKNLFYIIDTYMVKSPRGEYHDLRKDKTLL
jgi:hypothetical protein